MNIVQAAFLPTLHKDLKYDEENRVLKDEQKEYSYKNSDYSNTPELFTRRYEYTYNDYSSEADSKYYENNILKMKIQYTAQKGTYNSWIYFDSAFSVKTYYEDDLRVRDEYYNNGQLFRTKVYEKPAEAEETESVIHQGEER